MTSSALLLGLWAALSALAFTRAGDISESGAAPRAGRIAAVTPQAQGDVIHVRTGAGVLAYRVESGTAILSPGDARALVGTTPEWSLILVASYPFFSTGPVRQRFVVHARPAPAS